MRVRVQDLGVKVRRGWVCSHGEGSEEVIQSQTRAWDPWVGFRDGCVALEGDVVRSQPRVTSILRVKRGLLINK